MLFKITLQLIRNLFEEHPTFFDTFEMKLQQLVNSLHYDF